MGEFVEPQVNAWLSFDHEIEIVKRTIDQLRDPAFQEDFIEHETRKTRALVADAEYAIGSKRNNPENFPDRAMIAEARLRERQQDYIRVFGTATSAMVELAEELEQARELDEFDDSALLWTRSPNHQAEVGPDGLAYNSGLVHTIGYWASARKRSRFKGNPYFQDGIPTYEYFINASHDLSGHLLDADQSTQARTVILEDDMGNRKFYLHRGWRNGMVIIGFQHHLDDEPKIATFIPGAKEEYIDRCVADCMTGDDRAQLNRLLTPAHTIYDWSPKTGVKLRDDWDWGE